MDGMEMSEDVLTEILAKLPCKSLARFQCVSPSWDRIISSDYLRRRLPLITSGVLFHDGPPRGVSGRKQQQAYTYACASEDGVAEAADMSFFPCHDTSTIIDGLQRPSPLLRRVLVLPDPVVPRREPDHAPVVCFTGWLPRGASVEVFDSESGAWREHAAVDFGIDTDAMSATMHYSGGALHVLAYSGHVVRLDLDAMDCRVTALPAPVSCRARAGHCRGRLRFASSDGARLKVWELVIKDAGRGEWALRHEVGVKDLGASEAVTFLFMAFHPEREVVYLWAPWKLVAFDMETRRVEEEWAFGSKKEGAHLIQIWLFPFTRHLANCLA
ncbi:hypothetical protein PR202_gb04036 [Eleusine coracana subsp. coracana]|uniref:F-box domain-containing protein n=1 Tax=Eleusine coracana subsp. coracana TaxID=191504 RepID=A0AAV5E2J3_ELECO|nr:hypothetical protein PR202_gb04036 [Eleusine coracana subsp. coracana]